MLIWSYPVSRIQGISMNSIVGICPIAIVRITVAEFAYSTPAYVKPRLNYYIKITL